MVILGIDPGLAIVGFGLIKYEKMRFTTLAYGAITTPAGTEVHDRLYTIHNKLTEIIESHMPDELAIEEIFFNTNQKTVISVSEARGVILLAAKQNGLIINEYTPLQVKQAVVGYGRAEKIQVMTMVKSLLNLDKIPKPDDVADALAIAVCHAHTSGSMTRLAQSMKNMK